MCIYFVPKLQPVYDGGYRVDLPVAFNPKRFNDIYNSTETNAQRLQHESKLHPRRSEPKTRVQFNSSRVYLHSS